MEQHIKQWLAYINSTIERNRLIDVVVNGDVMVVDRGVHYVAKVPENDGWFVNNALDADDYVLEDLPEDPTEDLPEELEGKEMVVIANPDSCILDYDERINVIIWDDAVHDHSFACVEPCAKYFSVDKTWPMNLIHVPDVQAELPGVYRPQEWFPYNVVVRNRDQLQYYVIRCFNVLDGRLMEIDEDDSVNGIRYLDSWGSD